MRTRILLALLIGIGAAWAVTASSGSLRSLTNTVLLIGLSVVVLATVYIVGIHPGSRRRALRIVLLCFATTLAVAGLEIPALLGVLDYRVLFVPKMPGGKGPHNRVLEPGILYRRHAHDTFTSDLYGDGVIVAGVAAERRYTVDYQADANGMRNTEDHETADVVLLGDSFVEGYRVKQDENVAAHLARSSGQTVINLGHSGWGPGHELAALERFGVPLEPKHVFWFFYEGNDLRNLEEHRIAMEDFEAWRAREMRFRHRSLVNNGRCVLEGLAAAFLRSGHSDRALALSGLFGEPRQRLFFTTFPHPLDAHYRDLLDGTHEILTSAREATESVGGTFHLVFVPTKFRAYGPSCDFEEASKCRAWQTNALPRRLSSWAEKTGTDFIDLTETMQAAAARGELLYLTDDPHWNPDGERVVAERLLPLIAK